MDKDRGSNHQCVIICPTKKPNIGKKIFFGEYDRYIRIDYVSHPIAQKLKEHSESNTWFTRELDFKEDITNWKKLGEKEQRVFFLNIVYQNLMDSGVSNGFLEVIVPIITQPIWQLLYARIGYEETIHSESYSYALNTIFGADASKILDLVYQDKYVQKRLSNEVDAYKNVYEYVLLGGNKDDLAKRYILEMFLRIYFLEGVKFPFSFFVAWRINENYGNPIQGIARMLKLIAWDELTTHIPTGRTLMNILRNEPEQEFQHLFTSGWFDEIALKIAKETAQQEIEWANYLLKDGELKGLTKEITHHFIRFMTDKMLKGIKVEPLFNEKHSEIISWFDNYRMINNYNTALQEADNISYQKSQIKNDLHSQITINNIKQNLKNLGL